MNKKVLLLFLIINTSMLFYSCVDLPEDLAMPSWDTEIQVPIADSVITLEDAIDDDSLLTYSQNSEDYGLIYFTQTDKLDDIKVDNSITIPGFKKSIGSKFGNIKISDIVPIILLVDVATLTNGLISHGNYKIPQIQNTIDLAFTSSDQFAEITLEKGDLNLELKNTTDFDLEVNNIFIKNIDDGNIIAQKIDIPVTVVANSSITQKFDLGGKDVKNKLSFSAEYSTPGSGGETVTIDQNEGLLLTGSFDNLEIKKAVAPIPEQQAMSVKESFIFNDSSFISSAKIKEGSFDIIFRNNFPITIQIDATIDHFYKSDGTQYSKQLEIGPNQYQIFTVNSLSGWEISPNIEQNFLTCSANIRAHNSNGKLVELSSNDSLNIEVDFSEITFSSIAGQIAPTKVKIEDADFELELNEIRNKLSYSSIQFSESSQIQLILNPQVDVEFLLNGIITLYNDQEAKNITIDNYNLGNRNTSIIDLNDYGLVDVLNSFSNKLPDRLTFSGSAIVNPNYQSQVKVSSDDFITGEVSINLPLELGITEATYIDSLEIDLGEDITEDDINDIDFIELDLNIENEIPATLEITGKFFDTNGNYLMDLLTDDNIENSIPISLPEIDGSGNVVSAGITEQKIIMQGDNALKLLGKPTLVLKIHFNTTKNDANKLSKFKITDELRYRLFGKVKYRVNN